MTQTTTNSEPRERKRETQGMNRATVSHSRQLARSSVQNTCMRKYSTLLAVNSSISLAGSEEQIHFSQQSPKMLKMASESSIHALLLLLGLFVKISYWVPLLTMTSKIIENALLVLIYYVHAQLK